jgi:hypothetical protein
MSVAAGLHLDTVKLILTGESSGFEVIAGFFWASCLNRMAAAGAQRADTVISAADLPIMNLYGFLGFSFDRLLIGRHKHYGPSPG